MGGGFQGDEGSQPIRDQRSTLEFNRRDGAIRRRRRETDSDAPCIKQISMRSDHADSTGRRQTGGRTGRRIYTGNRSGINEHRIRMENRGTIYQSTFPKTGILEKRSNNPDRLSVRPRRYERKRIFWTIYRIRRSKDKEKRPWRINWIKTQKRIVRAIMKDQEKRDRRKHTGQYTAFDRQADKAIEEAKENIGLQGFTGSTRDQVIGKICQSLKDNTPWELLGETYCCRRLFYEYRKEFCYHVAASMDMIGSSRKTGQK